jgi:hypothetical protein
VAGSARRCSATSRPRSIRPARPRRCERGCHHLQDRGPCCRACQVHPAARLRDDALSKVCFDFRCSLLLDVRAEVLLHGRHPAHPRVRQEWHRRDEREIPGRRQCSLSMCRRRRPTDATIFGASGPFSGTFSPFVALCWTGAKTGSLPCVLSITGEVWTVPVVLQPDCICWGGG